MLSLAKVDSLCLYHHATLHHNANKDDNTMWGLTCMLIKRENARRTNEGGELKMYKICGKWKTNQMEFTIVEYKLTLKEQMSKYIIYTHGTFFSWILKYPSQAFLS